MLLVFDLVLFPQSSVFTESFVASNANEIIFFYLIPKKLGVLSPDLIRRDKIYCEFNKADD